MQLKNTSYLNTNANVVQLTESQTVELHFPSFPNQLVKVDSQIPLFLDTESPSQNKNLTNSSKLCDCIFFLHPLHCLQSFLVFNHKAIRKLSYSFLESCVFSRQLKIKSFIFNFKKSNVWFRVHLCFSTTNRKLV